MGSLTIVAHPDTNAIKPIANRVFSDITDPPIPKRKYLFGFDYFTYELKKQIYKPYSKLSAMTSLKKQSMARLNDNHFRLCSHAHSDGSKCRL